VVPSAIGIIEIESGKVVGRPGGMGMWIYCSSGTVLVLQNEKVWEMDGSDGSQKCESTYCY
jgi:hypothetical protein